MSQKVENILNLALEATPEERARSGELDVGYDPEEQEWELIVKYSGSLESVRKISSSVTELMNGYAVIVIREDRIAELAGFPEVEFIEKPKSLYFQVDVGRQVSIRISGTRTELRGSYRCGISRHQEILPRDIMQEVSLQGKRSMQCWKRVLQTDSRD